MGGQLAHSPQRWHTSTFPTPTLPAAGHPWPNRSTSWPKPHAGIWNIPQAAPLRISLDLACPKSASFAVVAVDYFTSRSSAPCIGRTSEEQTSMAASAVSTRRDHTVLHIVSNPSPGARASLDSSLSLETANKSQACRLKLKQTEVLETATLWIRSRTKRIPLCSRWHPVTWIGEDAHMMQERRLQSHRLSPVKELFTGINDNKILRCNSKMSAGNYRCGQEYIFK